MSPPIRSLPTSRQRRTRDRTPQPSGPIRTDTRFRGLAFLRAIAALVVVLGHVELLKYRSGIPTISGGPPAFWPDGHLAVVLFFVLSGFLISHLLIREKEVNGRIVLRNFYMRRVLRIWPLYYFVVLLSWGLTGGSRDPWALFFTLAILPNFPYAMELEWAGSPQIWSIGVEEQFYLVLPLIVRRVDVKRLPLLFTLFFLGYTVAPHVLGYVNARTLQSDSMGFLDRFFYTAKFNCMCVGCLLGVSLATSPRSIRGRGGALAFLYRKPVAYAAVCLSFGLWFMRVTFGSLTDEVYSVIFGIMILNLADNPNLKLNLDREPFTFLGNASYGIYMYHWLVILTVMKALPYDLFSSDVTYNVSIYGAVLIATVLASWVSSVTLERYFLRKKATFGGA